MLPELTQCNLVPHCFDRVPYPARVRIGLPTDMMEHSVVASGAMKDSPTLHVSQSNALLLGMPPL